MQKKKKIPRKKKDYYNVLEIFELIQISLFQNLNLHWKCL
jgi:hypothetical protein